MNFKIDVSDRFKKQLKILVKKYPLLKSEYSDLIESLEHNPVQGTPVGHSCYKIRLSITSKGKGKSGHQARRDAGDHLESPEFQFRSGQGGDAGLSGSHLPGASGDPGGTVWGPSGP